MLSPLGVLPFVPLLSVDVVPPAFSLPVVPPASGGSPSVPDGSPAVPLSPEGVVSWVPAGVVAEGFVFLISSPCPDFPTSAVVAPLPPSSAALDTAGCIALPTKSTAATVITSPLHFLFHTFIVRPTSSMYINSLLSQTSMSVIIIRRLPNMQAYFAR